MQIGGAAGLGSAIVRRMARYSMHVDVKEVLTRPDTRETRHPKVKRWHSALEVRWRDERGDLHRRQVTSREAESMTIDGLVEWVVVSVLGSREAVARCNRSRVP